MSDTERAVLYRSVRQHVRFRLGKLQDNSDTWVLVFPEHKIAYIPLPKAGNSSIRAELLRLIGPQAKNIANIQAFKGFDKRKFSDCRELLENDWYVFTVVRNPFARVASAYLDKVNTREEVLPALRKMGVQKKHNFHQFLKAISMWPTLTLNDHIMPSSVLLRKALLLPSFDVHKLENIDTAWHVISNKMTERTGIRFQPLGLRNKSSATTPWKNLYDGKSEELVRAIYKDDFSLFSYSDHLSEA